MTESAPFPHSWLLYVARPMATFLVLTSLEGYLPQSADGPHLTWYPVAYAVKIAVVVVVAWLCRAAWATETVAGTQDAYFGDRPGRGGGRRVGRARRALSVTAIPGNAAGVRPWELFRPRTIRVPGDPHGRPGRRGAVH